MIMSFYDDCPDYDESAYAGTYVHDVEGWDDDLKVFVQTGGKVSCQS